MMNLITLCVLTIFTLISPSFQHFQVSYIILPISDHNPIMPIDPLKQANTSNCDSVKWPPEILALR